MNENHPSPAELEVAQLRAEVGDLRFVIKLTWSIMVLFFGYLSVRALFAIPRFEKIFEDMLGDKNKLPELTKDVIAWSRAGSDLAAPATLFVIIIASLLAPWLVKNTRAAILVSLIASVALVAHTLICWSASFGPLFTVIQGLSGGGY